MSNHQQPSDSISDHSSPDTSQSVIADEKEEEAVYHDRTSEPVKSGPEASRRKLTRLNSQKSNLTSLYSSRSYGDGVCAEDPDEADVEKADSKKEDDHFRVQWTDGDSDNPRNMPLLKRWVAVVVLSTGSLCVTATSSLYTSTYVQTVPTFHTTELIATLGLSLFVIGLGIGPMVLAPFSEFYGRRIVYIISFAFFIIWLIPCAVAPNIATMLIARFIDGLAGSAFLSIAGGTVGDMFSRSELQAPMMVYTASPFIGPELGPLVGGFINYNTNWRWSFYVLIIWAGACYAAIVVFVPETYHPVLLRRKAERLRRETGDDRYYAPIEKMDRSLVKTLAYSCLRPFQLLLFEPMCLNLCIFTALLLGILYLFFGAFALVFKKNHDFKLWQVGLSFLGIFVGMVLGIATDPFWAKNYLRLVRKNEEETGEPGASEPEFRLPPAIFGAFLVPIGLFWFGWTTYRSVHWIVPIIGSGIFGTGTLLVFSGIFTFLVEAYPLYAASALAANSFARSSFAAGFPLFGVQMYNKLGFQWATSILAFISLALVPFPWLFFRYGKRIRGNSRFARTAT